MKKFLNKNKIMELYLNLEINTVSFVTVAV